MKHLPFTLPIDPSDEELARDWTLSVGDLAEVNRCRGDDMRHSFALQLCVLRRHGRFLGSDYSSVPLRLINHVGRQLGRPPVLIMAPPARPATDADHERRIREHLGYSTFDDDSRRKLEQWLASQTNNGLLADELIMGAESFLRLERIVLPARYAIERMVGAVAARLEEERYQVLAGRLTREQEMAFDALLDTKGRTRSVLFELKEYPPEPRPAAIITYLKRAALLRDLGAGSIDVSGLRKEVVHHFAKLVGRYDVSALKRFAPTKRYALMACFLLEINKSVLDHLAEMHHVFLVGLERRAKNVFEKQYRKLRQQSHRNLAVVLDVLEVMLDEPGTQRDIDLDGVRAALEACRCFQHLGDHGRLDALRARHHTLKRYLPPFLLLPFEGTPGTEALVAAIDHARRLHTEKSPSYGDAPIDFARGFWRSALLRSKDVRTWELALAFAVRDALRSGDLYLVESRHHVSFWDLIQSADEWAARRERAYTELALPTKFDHAVNRLRNELDTAAGAFLDTLPDNPFATVSDNRFKLARRQAVNIPTSVPQLRRVIESHLPQIRIEDLLVEVDSWCGFTRELEPAGTYAPRLQRPYVNLLAALVAHGTNLGLATMAQSAQGVTVDTLQRASRWYLRPESLKAANRVLIDFHHRLDIAAIWGDGTTSSSDGQRFGVQASSLLAGFYPRYFGYYERAINVYTHVSDQFSVYAAQAISCAPREAIYVLDGLLDNDTILRPREHYTDTHGSTDQLFGLCYLLGFAFMPRLKDIKDQQLYKLDRQRSYGRLDPLLRTANLSLIREQWDGLVRVAASLKDRTAPAHVVLDRLAASAPADRLAKALGMLGRIVKTTFILHYLRDQQLRARVHLQLNRGESRHALARWLFFANQGVFRTGDYEEIMNKVSALSVLSNAVLVWNTVRIAKLVNQLDTKAVDSAALAHVSPLMRAHIIPTGTYHFARAAEARA